MQVCIFIGRITPQRFFSQWYSYVSLQISCTWATVQILFWTHLTERWLFYILSWLRASSMTNSYKDSKCLYASHGTTMHPLYYSNFFSKELISLTFPQVCILDMSVISVIKNSTHFLLEPYSLLSLACWKPFLLIFLASFRICST